ncbi:MAG: hypothetical protein IPP15_20300 [Saprospiraceae bacterium]|uniref:Cadherin domain-containing protein n=1 Tax=Candidatus Opimibacter skivensis TaxID=2982028 RepID=A0A9D7XUD1_9BACT|nr:hypothetical protein [Candidatus Opimibacter skivensis]
MKHTIIFFLSFICIGIANSQATYKIISSVRSLQNDPPTGMDKTITILEDIGYVFAVADWGFNDPLDEPQNAFLAVKITTLPASGSIKLSGVNVSAGQFIPVTSLMSGSLTFIPLLNDNGSPYTTFTFQVQDDGGVSNGGIDLDPTPNTITFNVTPVNDAPTFLIGADQSVCKNSAAQSFPGWCTMISDGDPEVTQVVTFVVTNDNNSLFAVQPQVSSTGTLTYTPAANISGLAHVSVKLTDNGGVANGGINESAIQIATITLKPDFSWAGKISTDWFTVGNWCTAVPTATSLAIIYPAQFQPVITGANAICGHLTIMPSSTLNITAPQMLTVTGQ